MLSEACGGSHSIYRVCVCVCVCVCVSRVGVSVQGAGGVSVQGGLCPGGGAWMETPR